jgi:glycosidase
MRPHALALIPLAALIAAPAAAQRPAAPDTAWERGGTCYEVFVRSFQDSNGDGIGDLNGLTRRLDYINDGNPHSSRDLGADCIWLMPVAESPSYHGYDASDYYRVEPDYGTNDDFKRMVAEAHRRGIRVLVDMVLNHSSSQHPYFQQALNDPNSPYRSWYRFSPTDLGNGPWGGPAWRKSPVRDEYYYAVFWEGMPDLNYQTPAVREEAKKIATYWLTEMGADGFRLDAVPYLVEEGNVLAGSAGTHALLREYAAHVNRVRPGAYTVGEVWDSTGSMLKYYPGQLTSYFTFEISDSLLAAVNRGSAAHLLNGYLRLQQAGLAPTRYSPFLRNHDQTRTMTVLGGSVEKAKVAATLLLTLPGLPFVYYGEEIGMAADKPDEQLRTPMQWTGAPGAGFTTAAKPWEPLRPDSATANVERGNADPGSLLNLYRRLIHLRAQNPAIGGGTLVPVTASSDAVAAYLRRDGGRAVLVIANLGAAQVSRAALTAAAGALRPGRYVARPLVGGAPAAAFTVGADGAIRGYVPFATLAPMQAHVLELVRPGR